MMSSVGLESEASSTRAYSPEEVELLGYQVSVESKAFLGMVDCPLTELAFEKRATNFKTDATNYL